MCSNKNEKFLEPDVNIRNARIRTEGNCQQRHESASAQVIRQFWKNLKNDFVLYRNSIMNQKLKSDGEMLNRGETMGK